MKAKLDDILKIIKERIRFGESKKAQEPIVNWTHLEWLAFWDGEIRCAQALAEKIKRYEESL